MHVTVTPASALVLRITPCPVLGDGWEDGSLSHGVLSNDFRKPGVPRQMTSGPWSSQGLNVTTLPLSPTLRMWLCPEGLWQTKRLSLPCVETPWPINPLETSFLKEFRENVRDTERVCQRAVWDENQRILIDTYPIKALHPEMVSKACGPGWSVTDSV